MKKKMSYTYICDGCGRTHNYDFGENVCVSCGKEVCPSCCENDLCPDCYAQKQEKEYLDFESMKEKVISVIQDYNPDFVPDWRAEELKNVLGYFAR